MATPLSPHDVNDLLSDESTDGDVLAWRHTLDSLGYFQRAVAIDQLHHCQRLHAPECVCFLGPAYPVIPRPAWEKPRD